jgi:hypothetical protein
MTEPSQRCAEWNDTHAPGMKVRYQGRVTRTRSIATVVDGHTAVVYVEGTEIPAPLAHVEAAPDAFTDGEYAIETWRQRAAERADRDAINYDRMWLGVACVLLGVGLAVLWFAGPVTLLAWLFSGDKAGSETAPALLVGTVLAAGGAVWMRWALARLDKLGARPRIFTRKKGTK